MLRKFVYLRGRQRSQYSVLKGKIWLPMGHGVLWLGRGFDDLHLYAQGTQRWEKMRMKMYLYSTRFMCDIEQKEVFS